jgi:fibronectin type 3 domain-containing protein
VSSLLRIVSDPDTTPPSTPTIISVTAVGQNRLDIVWTVATDTGGSGLSGYNLLIDGDTTLTLGVQTSYSHTGIAASSTHTYRVQARDGAGNPGSLSAQAQGTAEAAPPAPGVYNPDYPRFGSYALGGTQNASNAALAATHVNVVIHWPGWQTSKGTTWATKAAQVKALSTIGTKIVPYTIYTEIQDIYSAAGTSEHDVWDHVNDNGLWVYQHGINKTNRIPSYQSGWSKINFTTEGELIDDETFAQWKINRDYRLNIQGGTFNNGSQTLTASANPIGFDGTYFDNAFSREQPAVNGATGDYDRNGTQDTLSSAASINLIQSSHAANVAYYRSLHPDALVLGNSNIWPIYHPAGITGLPLDQVFDGGVLEYIEEWAGYGNVIRGTTFASLLNAIRVQMDAYRPPKLGILSVFITSATNYQQLRYWHGIAALTDTYYYPHLTTGLLAQELNTLTYDEKTFQLGTAIDGPQYTPRYQAGANGTGIYVRRFQHGEVWVFAQGGTYTAQAIGANRWRILGTNNAGNTGALVTSLTGTAGDCIILANVAQDQTAPTVPGSLAATPTSGTQISLSWNASTDAGGSLLAGYKIERSLSPTSGFAQIATSTTTSYQSSGLTGGTTYYYRVRAYDGADNNSAYSNTATATTATSGTALFTDTFSTGNKNKTENGVAWTGTSVNVAIVSYANPFGSNFAMRFRYPAAPSAGGEGTAEQRFYLGPNATDGQYKEIWVEYVMVIPSNFFLRNDTGSDNNKFLRLWHGETSDGDNGYDDYIVKGGFSTLPMTTPGAGARVITEWGSNTVIGVSQESVGQNGTPSLAGWIDPADVGQVVTFVMRVKVDSIGQPGTDLAYPANTGNGALQAWKNGTRVANLTNIRWRSQTGAEDFLEYGYVLGYANQGYNEQTDFHLLRIRIATSNIFGVT